MNSPSRRVAALLGPVLLLTGCGAGGQQRTVHQLGDRMRATMAADIAGGRADVQTTHDGVQVTLLGTSSFPNDAASLADNRPDIRADVIEGLLDPSLMQVQVADTSTLPDAQRVTRIDNVNQYFVANGLGSTLASPTAAPSSPAGLTIFVTAQCPVPDARVGYGSGRSHPVCD